MGRSREKIQATAKTSRSSSRRSSSSVVRLRYQYFGHASDSAGRYGVVFDDLIKHLWRHRQVYGRFPIQTVRYMDDLVHAVACTNQISLGWTDLVERHELVLTRRCAERLGETQAILQVRRMFARLRPDVSGSLLSYIGHRPLRAWLAEQVLSQQPPRHSVWFRANSGGGSLQRGTTLLSSANDDQLAAEHEQTSMRLQFPGN